MWLSTHKDTAIVTSLKLKDPNESNIKYPNKTGNDLQHIKSF